MQEIVELIQKGFASVGEFKNCMPNICTESYPDADRRKRETMDLENNWPRYDEHSEASNGQCIWGDIKLGRLPKFVYDDRSASQVHADANSRTQEALNYKARYLDAF